MSTKYSIGLDYGTNSVRTVIVNISNGREVATAVWDYTHGEKGVLLSDNDFLSAATVLCTIGTRPNPLVERTLLTVERGRIVVNADLGVKDFAEYLQRCGGLDRLQQLRQQELLLQRKSL